MSSAELGAGVGVACEGWGASCDVSTVRVVTYVYGDTEGVGRFCSACGEILAASGAVVEHVSG